MQSSFIQLLTFHNIDLLLADLYKCTLYALIEMCQTKRLNMELVKEIAEIKDWTGSVSVKDFIYDMNYKGTKVY